MDLTKYPDFEARTPRATYTKTLQKICEKLNAYPQQTLEYDSMFIGTHVRADIKALGLWVVGSYARGALTCGDLDLVLELDGIKLCPNPNMLTKAFLGSMRGVRTHTGIPERNGSGVRFPEAVQVWAPGMDWKAAIAGIRANPAAGRFPRPWDAIPLRSEQTGLDVARMEQLSALRAAGVLEWSFTPLSAVNPVTEAEHRGEQRFLERLAKESAVKTKLAPYVAGFIRQLRKTRGIPSAFSPRAHDYWWQLGGVRINVDQLWLHAHYFDDLDTSCVVFVPAPTTRGPNGFWTIERGPNHWLHQSFSSASAYVLSQADGDVVVQLRPTKYSRVRVLQVFTDAQAAAGALQQTLDAQQPGTAKSGLLVKRVQGHALLESLASADIVSVDGKDEFPVSEYGAQVLHTASTAAPEHLCAALGGTTVARPGHH